MGPLMEPLEGWLAFCFTLPALCFPVTRSLESFLLVALAAVPLGQFCSVLGVVPGDPPMQRVPPVIFKPPVPHLKSLSAEDTKSVF